MRTCAGCNADIGHEQHLICMGFFWHPQCFQCHACKQPITEFEFSMRKNHFWPFHKNCYKELYHPRCDICKQYIPKKADNLVEVRKHSFWQRMYCPSHEHDDTSKCCSCERMEQIGANYLDLDDGRKLCPDCLDSSIMDTQDCQPLYHEIQEFFEGLRMKVEQQIPLLLVDSQELNDAMEGENNGHNLLPKISGLCLSEEQTVSTILRWPRFGKYRIIDMFMDPYRLIRRCEIRAILILYGLPRLLTGSILAHEMMHAWLRLNGYHDLNPEVEEGICQVLSYLWLDSEIMAGSGSSVASSSSSSSSSKNGKHSQFEKKLCELYKHQFETAFADYEYGFKEGRRAVLKYGLKRTLDHIRLTGCFP